MREESYRGLSVNNLEILIENNRKAPPNEVGLRNIEAMQRVKDYKEKYGDGLPTISTTTSSAAEALETLVQKNNDLDRQVADVTSRMAKIQEYTRKAEEAASKGDDEAAAKYAELASELEFGQNLDGEDGSLQPPSGRR
jgi:DNA repair ATPase RecN